MTPRSLAVGAVVLAVGAVALGGVTAAGVHKALPIVAMLHGSDAPATRIATVDLGLALAMLLGGGAVALAVAATARTDRRRRAALAVGWSQGAGILVFLVARVHGIAEVAALVPLFAIAATSVALQAIDRTRSGSTWRRPGAWAAAIGIVPWGVIAFTEVGGILSGDGPGLGIRIATLVALAAAIGGWALLWRRRAGPAAVVAMAVGLDLAASLLLAS